MRAACTMQVSAWGIQPLRLTASTRVPSRASTRRAMRRSPCTCFNAGLGRVWVQPVPCTVQGRLHVAQQVCAVASSGWRGRCHASRNCLAKNKCDGICQDAGHPAMYGVWTGSGKSPQWARLLLEDIKKPKYRMSGCLLTIFPVFCWLVSTCYLPALHCKHTMLHALVAHDKQRTSSLFDRWLVHLQAW